MRFLADENLPIDAVEALRAAGHDVAWVRRDAPGAADDAVLARAVAERRVLLTFDKDFGELAIRKRLPAGCGIVLFRLPVSAPGETASAVVAAIGSRTDWSGWFSVIEETRIRMRPLQPQ